MKSGILFTPLLLLACLSTGCSGERPVEKEAAPGLESLHQALDAFDVAYARADVSALDEMLTTGYLHTNGANPALDKEKWLNYVATRRQALDAGALVVDNYALLETRIRLYGHAAAVAGKARINGLNENGPFQEEFRVTQMWVFEEGGWKRAAFHDGRVR